MTTWKVEVALALLVVLLCAPAATTDVRDTIGAPTETVFARILQSAEKGDLTTVGKGMDLLKPLSDHLNQKLGIDAAGNVRRAASSGNKDEVVRAVQAYVVASLRVLMMESGEAASDAAAATEKMRYAAKEMQVLEPHIQKVNFSAASKLRELLQAMAQFAGKEPQLLRAKAKEFDSILAGVFSFAG